MTEDFSRRRLAAGLAGLLCNVVLEGEQILHSRMKKLLIIGCAAPRRIDERKDSTWLLLYMVELVECCLMARKTRTFGTLLNAVLVHISSSAMWRGQTAGYKLSCTRRQHTHTGLYAFDGGQIVGGKSRAATLIVMASTSTGCSITRPTRPHRSPIVFVLSPNKMQALSFLILSLCLSLFSLMKCRPQFLMNLRADY